MEDTRTSRPLPAAVGRYEILLPIASGGMATVYLARSRGARGFEREVALKLTHAHLNDSSEFAAVLLEEGRLAARIRHGNVVKILDVGEDPLGLFLVMEYIEGDSLSNLQREAQRVGAQVPANIGLRILLDALAGLHAAHELKDERGAPLLVVHRDFSPQNILVGQDGITQLTDFGVAKAANSDANTATGVMKGKVAYMSPEQARGLKVDRRTDVWAAGVVAWEILAGRKLYVNADGVSTLLKVVTETPPRLRTVAPHVPPEVDAVVAAALVHDVGRRCPTAADFASELSRACGLMTQIADASGVAQYVKELAGAKLAKRREQVERAAQLRAKMNALASASMASAGPSSVNNMSSLSLSTPSSDELAQLAIVEPAGDPTLVEQATLPMGEATIAAPPRAKRWPLLVAVATLAAMGTGAVVLWARAGKPPPPPATSSAVATAAPSSPPSTTPRAEEPPRSVARNVQIITSAPITALRVNGRRIPLTSPTANVVVPRAEDEIDKSIDVWAQTADGRQAVATLAGDAAVLRLQFPARPSAPQPPPPRSDCNPPYTLDADGVRIPKRHCQ